MNTSNAADIVVGIYWSWFIWLKLPLICVFKKNLTGEHRWEGMRWDCVFWQIHTHNMNRSSLCQKSRQKQEGGNMSTPQVLMKKYLCRTYMQELTNWLMCSQKNGRKCSYSSMSSWLSLCSTCWPFFTSSAPPLFKTFIDLLLR